MKRTVAATLLLALALTLCACGKKTEPKPVETPAPAPVETVNPAEEAAERAKAIADEAIALYNSGDYAAAFEKANTAADSSDPAIAAILGRAYYLGLGVDANSAKALGYLETASKGGYSIASYLLADAVEQGKGMRMDEAEAARRYIKFVAAADDADPSSFDYGAAMASLSDCFAKGKGVEKKFELALDAANKAAACNNLSPFELMALGDFYNAPMPNPVSKTADEAGTLTVETARKVDAEKAEKLYVLAVPGLQKLMSEGNTDAMKLLGDLYLDGKGGLEQDYAKAMEYYLRAAEEDNADAQAQLGYMYQNALGVPADYAKAMEWNNRAAQQGNAQGQAQIGYLYQNGLGVTQNLDEAGRWYTRAKESGSEWAAAKLEETEATNPHASFEAHA